MQVPLAPYERTGVPVSEDGEGAQQQGAGVRPPSQARGSHPLHSSTNGLQQGGHHGARGESSELPLQSGLNWTASSPAPSLWDCRPVS